MGIYCYTVTSYGPYLSHYGVKGMKWGIRKQKDAINSNRRTIKSGTELQTITEGQYQNGKRKRLYTSYTDYDKSMYVDLMGNYMYGRKSYKNTFMVKKDISVASDRKCGAQDPLIIVNMNKLNHTGSIKLSKKELDYYMDYSVYRKLEKKGKDLSSIQR